MNDMVVKSVDLMGDTVMAAQDSEGNIWAGINFFCRGLGMSKRQRDFQVEKVKADKALSKGCTLLRAGVLDTANEVYALRLDFVPIWLSKITITKKMEQDNPELADKLLEYQLKAKDILAEAFLPKQESNGDIQGQIKLLAQGTTELYEKVGAVDSKIDGVKADLEALKNDMPVFNSDAKDIQEALRKKATKALGGYGSSAYRDNSTRGYVFADIQKELRRQFQVKRYDQIKHKDTPLALEIISQYKLPIALQNRVDMVNAQQQLNL